MESFGKLIIKFMVKILKWENVLINISEKLKTKKDNVVAA